MKRALIYSITLSIVTLAVLVSIVLAVNKIENRNQTIAERAILVLATTQREQETTFFFERLARTALAQTIVELAASGGVPIRTNCEFTDNGIYILNTHEIPTTFCDIPLTTIQTEFSSTFWLLLDIFVRNNPGKDILINTIYKKEQPATYEFLIQPNKLIATALQPITFQDKKKTITYTFYPDFTVSMQVPDFQQYHLTAKTLVKECYVPPKEFEPLDPDFTFACLERNKPETWSLKREDQIVVFTSLVDVDLYPYYDKKPEMTFALWIPEKVDNK